MAQLKQDEWPKDNEPTTAEAEGDAFKREGPRPPARSTGDSIADMNEVASDSRRGHIAPPEHDDRPGRESMARGG